ncbi:MAG: rhomboid family intramembrane serine protease [Saprospiraceae bacterium]|nr:rhomboid family intramembrane serine protease [Saprospiraceae bacterium]
MSITLILVIITCIISIICFSNKPLFEALKHYPVAEYHNKEYYRLISSGFVHGDFMHLFLNMFVLHEFGRYVELYFQTYFGDAQGKIIFLILYIVIIITGDLPTFFKHKENRYFASVGASGAVSGIIFIYILLNPWAMLGLFAVIPVPAIVFGVLYLWYSSWASKNNRDMIDHEAHFYGAVAGIILAIALRPAVMGEFVDKLINQFPLG